MTEGFLMEDIRGRVNNTPLQKSKYLWALFEAIVNSIQSIEDAGISNGYIDIRAERREETQLLIDTSGRHRNGDEIKQETSPFVSFSVTDNGQGFTAENHKSFRTADSLFKWEKGCKGIGRFLWLKSFDCIRVKSNFKEKDKWYKREFEFSFKGVLPEDNLTDSDVEECKTTVFLNGFQKPYVEMCPKSLESIAKGIIEHCRIYFILGKIPRIVIRDSLGEVIDLNQYYKNNISETLHKDNFDFAQKSFVLYHVKITGSEDSHALHLCANEREVKSINLKNHIPNLQQKIEEDERKGFFYCGYLTGSYLDEQVNSSRTNFLFADERQMEIENSATEQGLMEEVKKFITAYLKEHIEKIDDKKKKHINNFVAHQKPQYRFLLHQKPDIINEIKPNLSDSELEIELHSQVMKWETEIKKRGEEIKEKIAQNITSADVKPNLEEYCKEVNSINMVSLAEYIIRRKVILDLLQTAIEKKDDGTYAKESQIHTIICPMRYTSDEIGFEEMNLWVIDERLAYHNFLASDKQMRELPTIDSQSKDRMDIAIFDEAFSFAEKDNAFDSITIIEFKKPNRGGLNSPDKDPLHQVFRYVQEIKDGKQKKANGRPFGNVQNTAFYCYIIADLTESMREAAKGGSLNPTPDGEGFFGFNQNYGAYIEVISYDKLLNDAKERNRILFDKLFDTNPKEIVSRDEFIPMVGTAIDAFNIFTNNNTERKN